MTKTLDYCLNLEIKENIDNWLKHIHNPIYATICRIYETAGYDSNLMSKEEVTFFIHYTLENIRTIREITTLHPTHISYLAKKLGFYIIDMNNVAHGTLKTEDISRWSSRILLLCCAILSHTDDPMLNDFANQALYVLNGMYGIYGVYKIENRQTINLLKNSIKEMSTPETFQYAKKYSLADKFYIILDESKTSDHSFTNEDGSGCIYLGRNISECIQDTILRICCDQVNERCIFNMNPYIYWENLINTMIETDDTTKISQFLNRAVKNSTMESEIKQNVHDAITEKVDNINKEVLVTCSPSKFEFHFSNGSNVKIGSAETIVCDNHGTMNF